MSFDVGTLVRARGREWVVLPKHNEDPDMLVLRPLSGSEEEITGVYLPIEKVESAEFKLPDPECDLGNHLSCRLLRDATRLGFRSGAGPFRSLARIAIEPRPYQLVPLLMALKLDPVRILIADDVGVGKTVEACLIARELYDRGEIRGFTVLCPPHLAEQWQKALNDQFCIEAELVLSGTVAKLEKHCKHDESLFSRFPFTVVSTDYVKSEKNRYEFLRSCPELVIVDEAHTCTSSITSGSGQKRHELLRDLTDPKDKSGELRHLILVTATPHSGNQETFHSLLSLLDRQFIDFPSELAGEMNRSKREILARHFVQRRRGDLESYLDSKTPFPVRENVEEHYTLTPEYRQFFDKVLAYCRESVRKKDIEERKQRVRWWSALALLRSLSSSPKAAMATLRNRSSASLKDTVEAVDDEGRRTILDIDDESTDGIDIVPGSEIEDQSDSERRRLLSLAKEAEGLLGQNDSKLLGLVKIVTKLMNDGYSPIIFCRFIATVEYVYEFLVKEFNSKEICIGSVTGLQTPEVRERRVNELAKSRKRILVCTDCLSEGINLQHIFDSVVHYDLSWNPTRHEQREGRVDRYNQPKSEVLTLTYYGKDNPVDGIVLEVLLRKHQEIRKQLGVAVPLPTDTKVIEDAIYQGLLIRERIDAMQLSFEFLEPYHKEVANEWDKTVNREKRSRTIFAQNQLLKAVNDQIRTELEEVRHSIGSAADVKQFTESSLKKFGATISGDNPLKINLSETGKALQDIVGVSGSFEATFSHNPGLNAKYLTRTHSFVEGLASYTLESAFDSHFPIRTGRCGVIRTNGVDKRTSLFLVRIRMNIENYGRDRVVRPILVEDLLLTSFRGSPENAEWLAEKETLELLDIQPDENIDTDQAKIQLGQILSSYEILEPKLNQIALDRGNHIYEVHRRVRKATKSGIRELKVNLHQPIDILGLYLFLPVLK